MFNITGLKGGIRGEGFLTIPHAHQHVTPEGPCEDYCRVTESLKAVHRGEVIYGAPGKSWF